MPSILTLYSEKYIHLDLMEHRERGLSFKRYNKAARRFHGDFNEFS